MNLIETYNGSGFYAQYATSADNALYDENGTPLTSYQPVSSMTAYQEAGDYYSASNPSGFITEVPAGTMNESAFSYDASDNITAYNGSAFKAGDEFPQSATEAIETVTANSADWNGTTETVSSNSGVWGGSALPISAGPGIKFEMVDNTLVASVGSEWINISEQCTIGSHEGDCKVYVNSASRLCWLCGAWKPSKNGAYITVPVQYAWPSRFEIANNMGKHLDFNDTGNNNIATVREADASSTYWSECIFWGY